MTLAKHDLTGINDTGDVCMGGVIGTGEVRSDAELFRYQTFQILNFLNTEHFRFHTFQILIFSYPELFRNQIFQILNFSVIGFFRFRTFQIPNFSDTKLSRYQTFQILNFSDNDFSDTKLIGYRTFQIPTYRIQKFFFLHVGELMHKTIHLRAAGRGIGDWDELMD
jgi:hypothetical protein